MAPRILFEAYNLRIRKKRDKDNFLSLSLFNAKDDLFKVLFDFIAGMGELKISESHSKSIKFIDDSLTVDEENRTISGFFESGEYGRDSRIINIDTGEMEFSKKKQHSDLLPFYFLVEVPKDSDVGFLILQRYGGIGIFTIFRHFLRDYISKHHGEYSIELNPLLSKDFVENYLGKGSINQICLRKFNLPPDICETLGIQKYDSKQNISLELRIKSREKIVGMVDRVKSFIKDPNTKFFETSHVSALGLNEDSRVLVTSKYNNSTRTIDLSELNNGRPYYDVDDLVKRTDGNHPVFDSINNEALKLLSELKGD